MQFGKSRLLLRGHLRRAPTFTSAITRGAVLRDLLAVTPITGMSHPGMADRIATAKLLNLGSPPHGVHEIVGRSAIEVAMTIYAHVSLKDQRKALGNLGEALG
jgi:hypothetical protein